VMNAKKMGFINAIQTGIHGFIYERTVTGYSYGVVSYKAFHALWPFCDLLYFPM
jgi:hypothetical protein